jgi:signal transduction histidine kinase
MDSSIERLDSIIYMLEKTLDVRNSEVQYTETDPEDIIAEVMASSALIGNAIVPVRFECLNHAGSQIMTDPMLLAAILQKLIDNSVKYARAISDSYVKVSFQKSYNQLVIQVEDNGQGIDPRFLDRIFEMFFRANEYSTGLGLGLYLVRKMVEKMEGKIHVRSIPNRGTLFTLSFPLR